MDLLHREIVSKISGRLGHTGVKEDSKISNLTRVYSTVTGV